MRHVSALLLALALLTGGQNPAQSREPIKVLLITGDHGHNWKQTTPFIKNLLTRAGMQVDVTEAPGKDLTPPRLSGYDVLFLNYRDTRNGKPETRWSEANKRAFMDAVEFGKGLVVYHHASSAFTSDSKLDLAFGDIIAGGWRKQGNHGKRHVFTVATRKPDHPIMNGMPAEFRHANDELYQNSVLPADASVLATAFSDKRIDPKNSDKHEPVVWVVTRGKGRVCENVLGHDVDAMKELGFQTLLIRCVEWTANGRVNHAVPAELKAGGSR